MVLGWLQSLGRLSYLALEYSELEIGSFLITVILIVVLHKVDKSNGLKSKAYFRYKLEYGVPHTNLSTDKYFFAAGISVWANPKEDRRCFSLVLQIITAYQSQYYFRNGSINSQCSQLLSGVCGREHLPSQASNAQECKKLKFINQQEWIYA